MKPFINITRKIYMEIVVALLASRCRSISCVAPVASTVTIGDGDGNSPSEI